MNEGMSARSNPNNESRAPPRARFPTGSSENTARKVDALGDCLLPGCCKVAAHSLPRISFTASTLAFLRLIYSKLHFSAPSFPFLCALLATTCPRRARVCAAARDKSGGSVSCCSAHICDFRVCMRLLSAASPTSS